MHIGLILLPLNEVDRRSIRRIFLAGGLNAGNIQAVLQILRPVVVDIASGVEETAREKERKLMTDFFAALGIKY